MSATSDLDLMTLYRADAPGAASETKGWGAEVFYGRFTQRLIAALSTQTAEGGLYEVDMQLRPSGTKGPVAVSAAAFDEYYMGEAETWELLALTRARVVWASSEAFSVQACEAIERALRRTEERSKIATDVREMRELMERERPPHGPWDLKLAPGGLVDIEFAAQFLQLAHAGEGGPLRQATAEALTAAGAAGLAPAAQITALLKAWKLQQDLTQLLKVALDDGADPDVEPKAFKTLLARAGHARDYRALRGKLRAARDTARKAYDIIVQP
jgi:glutamate-ammonia-ligase adenylyltransferase